MVKPALTVLVVGYGAGLALFSLSFLVVDTVLVAVRREAEGS